MLFNRKFTITNIPSQQTKKCCIKGDAEVVDARTKRVVLLDRKSMKLYASQNVKPDNSFELIYTQDPGDENLLLIGLDEGGNYNVSSFDRVSLGLKKYTFDEQQWNQYLDNTEAYYTRDVELISSDELTDIIKQKGKTESFMPLENLSLEFFEDREARLKHSGEIVDDFEDIKELLLKGNRLLLETGEVKVTETGNTVFVSPAVERQINDVLKDGSCIMNLPFQSFIYDYVKTYSIAPFNIQKDNPVFTLTDGAGINTDCYPLGECSFCFRITKTMNKSGYIPLLQVENIFEVGLQSSGYIYVAYNNCNSATTSFGMGNGTFFLFVTINSEGLQIYKDNMTNTAGSVSHIKSTSLTGKNRLIIGGISRYHKKTIKNTTHRLKHLRVFNKALSQEERILVKEKNNTKQTRTVAIEKISFFPDATTTLKAGRPLAAARFISDFQTFPPFYSAALNKIDIHTKNHVNNSEIQYIEFSIKKENIPINFTNYKAVVNLADYPQVFDSISKSSDLAITAEDGQILYTEVESFDKTARKGLLWFSLPRVYSDKDTHYALIYPCDSEKTDITGSLSSRNIWTDYAFTYHLNQDPVGTDALTDAATGDTSDSYNMSKADKSFAPLSSFEYSFDSTGYLNLGRPVTEPLPEGTLEIVFKTSQPKSHILSQDADGRNNRDLNLSIGKPTGVIENVPDGHLVFESSGPGTDESLSLKSINPLNDNQYHYAGISWYNGRQILNIDGNRDIHPGSFHMGNNAPLLLGADREGDFFSGKLYELIIDKKFRTKEYTRLFNKSLNNELITYSANPNGLPQYSRKIPITIDHTKVSQDLIHYPLSIEFDNKRIYHAKSVIFDFADNWGSSRIAVRSIDFYYKDQLLQLTDADFTAYATTEYTVNYLAANMFITSKSKTGYPENNEYFSETNKNTRVVLVLNTPIKFDTIIVNNAHYGGSNSNDVKNVEIHTSSDAITDTTYQAEIPNSEPVFKGRLRRHIPENVEDPQIISLDQTKGSPAEFTDFFNYISWKTRKQICIVDSENSQLYIEIKDKSSLPGNVCKPEYTFGDVHPEHPNTGFDGNTASYQVYGSYYAYKDGAFATKGTLGQAFPEPIAISGYSIYIHYNVSGSYEPKNWTFEASEKGLFQGEQVVLDTQTGHGNFNHEKWYHFKFTNTEKYKYYRINITKNCGGSRLVITELEMYETVPGFTLTASGPDFTIKSNQDTNLLLYYGAEKKNIEFTGDKGERPEVYPEETPPQINDLITLGEPKDSCDTPGSINSTASITNLPVKIDLNPQSGITSVDMTPLITGDFTKLKVVCNTALCNTEVLKWETGSRAILYALIPRLNPGENTFSIYNTDQTNPKIATSGDKTSKKIWKDYQLVYHLNQTPSSGIKDATANHADALLHNIDDTDSDGLCLTLNGTDQKIEIPDFINRKTEQGSIHISFSTQQNTGTLLSQKNQQNKGLTIKTGKTSPGRLTIDNHDASLTQESLHTVNNNRIQNLSFSFQDFKRDFYISSQNQIPIHTGFFGSTGATDILVAKHYAAGTTFQGSIVDIRLSKKAKTQPELTTTNKMWKQTLLQNTTDTAKIYIYPSFDKGNTYKTFTNDKWIPVVSNKESVHTITGNNNYHYHNTNTWIQAPDVLTALQNASHYYKNTIQQIKDFDSAKWTAPGGLTTQGFWEAAFVFDSQIIPSIKPSIEKILFQNHQIIMTKKIDLEPYNQKITGSSLLYNTKIFPQKNSNIPDIKIFSCITGGTWQQCTQNSPIPDITPAMTTTGKKLRFKILLPDNYPAESTITFVPQIY